MRRYTFVLMLLVAMTAVAQSTDHSRGHSLEVTVGGGYSSLGYKPNSFETLDASSSGSYNLQAHIGYNFFFIEYMGVGIGADIARYGHTTTLKGELVYAGVTDTDGERYDHHVSLHDWDESQDLWALEVPLSLVFSIPIQDRVYITAQVGGKCGVPVASNYKGSGTITHYGYYEPWDLTLSDMANHGFYTNKDFAPKGKWDSQIYWSVFAKAGVAIPLIEHLDLLVQVYFNYALTKASQEGEEYGVVGFRNDRADGAAIHTFMPEYTDLRNTPVITSTYKPWSVGAEVGIRYTIPMRQHSKYPCRCVNDAYGIYTY